jgi:hypothetical protein
MNAYNILVGKLKGRDHLRDLAVDRTMILKWCSHLKGIGCENMYWIHMAEDGAQWRYLVSTVMDFLLP